MLDLLLAIIATVCVIGLVMLIAPVRLRVVAKPEESTVEIRYLFLRIRRNLMTGMQQVAIGRWVVQSGIPSGVKPPRKKKPEEEKEEGPEKPVRERAQLIWNSRPMLRRTVLIVARLVGRLLRSLHLERADVAVELGLGDPARTGMATGVFYATRASVAMLIPKLTVTLAPDFYQTRFAFESDIRLRVIPVEPIYHVVRALGTLPWRGLWKLKNAWTS